MTCIAISWPGPGGVASHPLHGRPRVREHCERPSVISPSWREEETVSNRRELRIVSLVSSAHTESDALPSRLGPTERPLLVAVSVLAVCCAGGG